MKKRNSFYKVLSLLVTLAMVCGMAITSAAATDDEYLPDGDDTEITETAEKIANESTTDSVEDVSQPTAESTEEEVAETTAEPAEEAPADNETEPVEEPEDVLDTETTPYGWWPDYADTSWYNESSTTFTLTTAAQLAGLAKLVNAGNDFAGKTVKLGAYVDLSVHKWVPIGGNQGISNSTPTGTAFAGTFDAGYVENGRIRNYVITGMIIRWNIGNSIPSGTVTANANYAGFGLFGKVTGTIENVDVYGEITSDARIYAVGGVVGYTTGSVIGCDSNVNINVTSVYAARTGGVVGQAVNTGERVNYIRYCANFGSVTGARYVGGIVGSMECTAAGGVAVDTCFNTGTVKTVCDGAVYLGGIAGYCNGYIEDVYSRATIALPENKADTVGGLVGRMQGAQAVLRNAYAANTYTGNQTGCAYAIGVVGNNETVISNVLWMPISGSNVQQTIATGSNNFGWWTNCGPATAGLLQGTASGNPAVYTSTGSSYTTTQTQSLMDILGSNFTRVDTMNDRYPVLFWQPDGLTQADEDEEPEIETSVDNLKNGSSYVSAVVGMTYTIEDQNAMDTFVGYVNAGKPTAGVTFEITGDGGYTVTQVIAQPKLESDASTYSPIVTGGIGFEGTFDGNKKELKVNINVDVTADSTSANAKTGGTGLFGYLAPSGVVKYLTVSGSVTSNVGSDGNAIGGVVGYNSGTIENVTNEATVTATETFNIGGICGFNNGYYGTSPVGKIQHCLNTGLVVGNRKVGGIAGENSGLIAQCGNTANITSSYQYKNGIGGIAGRNGNNDTAVETGVIRNCYNQGNISSGTADDGGSWIGGITGFQNAFSTCTNCYNTGTLTGYDYMDNTAGDSDNTASDKGVVNCYGPSEANGAQHYDGTNLWELADMKAGTSLAAALNGDPSSGLWQQTPGQYPILVNCGSSGSGTGTTASYEIVITKQPNKTSYIAGETFDPAGMVVEAVYKRESVAITAYTFTPNGALAAGTTYVTISGTYNGKDFSVRQPITVTAASNTTIILGGSSAGAYQNLADALSAAKTQGATTIYVDGTVSLASGTYDGGTDQITLLRNTGFHDILFEVPADANVTLKNLILDGNSGAEEDNKTCKNLVRVLTGGTLNVEDTVTMDHVNSEASGGAIHVEGGTVTFNGLIQNCVAQNGGGVYVSDGFFTMTGGSITGCEAQAVDNAEGGRGGGVCVTNGTFTMKDGTITGCTASTKGSAIYLGAQIPADAENKLSKDNFPNMVLSPAAGTKIDGIVYLAQTVYQSALTTATVVQVGSSLSNLSGGLTIECAYPQSGLEVIRGKDYSLENEDMSCVTYQDGYGVLGLDRSNNKITLTSSKVVYLRGAGTVDYLTTYQTLDDAISNVPDGGAIYVIGTTALEKSYPDSVTVQRGADLTGEMFTVAEDETAVLSGMTINGGGRGTIVNVTGGTLTLSGGVTLANCATAVNLTGGNLTVTQASLNGTQYSVYMGANSGTFTLIPNEDTALSGTVYLANNKWITVDGEDRVADMAGKIVIQCADPSTNPATLVAQAAEDYAFFDEDDVSKFEYLNNAYSIIIQSGEDENRLILSSAFTAE